MNISSRNNFWRCVLAFCLIIALSIVFAPWKQIAQWQIARQLDALDIKNVSFTVSEIGLSGVVLSDIVYDSYTLDDLALDFTLSDIISGNFNRLHVNHLGIALGDIQLSLSDIQTVWSMNAQGPGRGATWSINEIDIKNAPVALPKLRVEGTLSLLPHELLVMGTLTSETTKDRIAFTASYPFEKGVDAVFSITEASLHVMGETTINKLRLMFNPELVARGVITSLHVASLSHRQKKAAVTLTGFASDWEYDAALSRKKTHWTIADVAFIHLSVVLPNMQASGDITLDDVHYALSGDIYDAKKMHHIAFGVTAPNDAPKMAKVTIRRASYPWEGGIITLGHTQFPVFGSAAIPFTVGFKHIPLEHILSLAIKDKVRASGFVSGSIPIMVARNGALQFGSGTIAAIEKGVINLDEGAIPGDQAQINLVRDVMKDFHYSTLSIDVAGNPKKQNALSLLLSLRGNNPDVYDGRDIHLNIRLNGDVLSLVTQSMAVFNDPQSFLTQE